MYFGTFGFGGDHDPETEALTPPKVKIQTLVYHTKQIEIKQHYTDLMVF